jgi:hypothetical protein
MMCLLPRTIRRTGSLTHNSPEDAKRRPADVNRNGTTVRRAAERSSSADRPAEMGLDSIKNEYDRSGPLHGVEVGFYVQFETTSA